MGNLNSDIELFLEGLKFRIETIDRYKRQMDRLLASDFNVFRFLDPDENRLSDILADLLDPLGRHGQGTLFLIAFLMPLSCGKNNQKTIFGELIGHINRGDAVHVTREMQTEHVPSFRRMDIVIHTNGLAIMIENKPWAHDQSNQLTEYFNDLKRRFSCGVGILYLNKIGSPPSEDSFNKEMRSELLNKGSYAEISWSDYMWKWLKQCTRDAESDKIRYFLRDFTAYVQGKFLLDQSQTGEENV